MLQSLIAALDTYGIGRRTQMLLLGGVVLAGLWGVYTWATGPTWVPAYSGVELADAARITARLDEDGITHRLERGGSEILVPSDELIDARIALDKEPSIRLHEGAGGRMLHGPKGVVATFDLSEESKSC